MRFKKIITTIICFALFMTTIGFQNVAFAEELTDVSEETTDEDEITADTSVIDEEVDDGITIEEVNDTDIELLKDYEETDVENTDESDDVFDEEADLTQSNLLDFLKNNAVTLNYNTINGITLKKGEKRKVYKFTLTKDAIFSYNIKGYSDVVKGGDRLELCIFDEYEMEKDDRNSYRYTTVREYYHFLWGDIKSYDESFCLRKGNYYLDISLDAAYNGPVHLELETAVSYLNSTEKDNNDDFENAQEISNSSTYYGVAPINDYTDIYKFSTNNSREIHLSINTYGERKKNYGTVILYYDDFREQKRIILDSKDTTHFDLTFEVLRAGEYYPGTYYIKFEGFSQGCYDFTVSMPTDGTISTSGIYCASNYPSIQAGINIQKSNESDMVEYRWVACNSNEPDKWFEISPWTKENNWMVWTPDKSGGYVFVCYARVVGNENASQIQATFGTEYRKAIKGICQMPYTGEGGGYLIGIESYDNPNHSYKYEMLILDCNLYVQGKDAWVYDTGKCGAPENCLWTIWQPQYGYYWTLFRIYDQNDNLIDEACYGFENVY